MAEEQSKTKKTAIKKIVFLVALMILGIIALGYFFSLKLIITAAIFILFVFLVVFFIVKGFNTVQEQKRIVVEFFGRYWRTKEPGLRWNFPGIIKVRADVSIWQQTLILFEAPIKIDFKDGSAVPKGARAFVKIKKPDEPYQLEGEEKPRTGVFRAVYFVDNWRKRTIELLENAVRSYLATLTIDEALSGKRGGFDLLIANRIPKNEKGKIKKAMDEFGLELLRITITDFDLEPDLVKARGEVQKRKRAVEIAEFGKEVRAHETVGALIQMLAEARGKRFDEIQKEINEDSGLKEKIILFSQELVTRQMSIDGKSLTDVRVSGVGGAGGDIFNSLLALIAACKQIPKEKAGGPQKKEKTERKEQSQKRQPEEDED